MKNIALLIYILFPILTQAQLLDEIFRSAQTVVNQMDTVFLQVTAVSDSEEVAVGKELAKQIRKQSKMIKKSDYLERIRKIGNQLAKQVKRKKIHPYHFYLIDQGKDVNAFATAGGHIWVLQAMQHFTINEDELAALLAHEIVHVDEKHCIARMQAGIAAGKVGGSAAADLATVGYSLLKTPFNRDQEVVADTVGLRLMMQAGYNPQGMITFMQKMIEWEAKHGVYNPPQNVIEELGYTLSEYLRSHPNFKTRLEHVKTALKRLQGEK
ncbi:MAG: M48 family metalloprotease [bacterium]|nr:M48 family metalloprotease [bacterium]